jgi:hypothetical protein
VWLRELKWWLITYEEGVYILAGKEISPGGIRSMHVSLLFL